MTSAQLGVDSCVFLVDIFRELQECARRCGWVYCVKVVVSRGSFPGRRPESLKAGIMELLGG